MPHRDHEKNRIAWNEMAEVHFRHPDYQVKEFLDGWCSLHPIELDELGDVAGKKLLHLQCQFGLDTLSWARRGAEVTGVDISDWSIARAHELVEKSGVPGRFIEGDVLELIGKIDDRFDIVFQSYGTHCWLSDIKRWAEVVAHYLKPGGVFYIIDFHPVSSSCLYDEVESYFDRGPYRYRDESDYCDRDYIVKSERVEWQHTLADIVSAVAQAGLRLEFLHEFDVTCDPEDDTWLKDGRYLRPPKPVKFPLMFSIKARKD